MKMFMLEILRRDLQRGESRTGGSVHGFNCWFSAFRFSVSIFHQVSLNFCQLQGKLNESQNTELNMHGRNTFLETRHTWLSPGNTFLPVLLEEEYRSYGL
jgi:hypothetical protein